MAMIGMDIEAVQALASKMNSTADEIDATVRNLTSTLSNTAWTGPDRNKFDGEWNGASSNELMMVARQLRDTSTYLNQQAQEQMRASM